jgi:hypothetical protein
MQLPIIDFLPEVNEKRGLIHVGLVAKGSEQAFRYPLSPSTIPNPEQQLEEKTVELNRVESGKQGTQAK